ncbi:MAG: hypothetical protein QM770_17895 [Tepidisphaeraceae bacterium]
MSSSFSSAPVGAGQRFEVRPYKPSSGAPIAGVLQLIAGLALAGAVLGFVAFYVSKAIWLILVFPLLIGLALAFVAGWLVKKGHVRNGALAGLAAFIGGVFAMTVMHYEGYRDVMTKIEAQPKDVRESWQNVTEQEVRDESPPAELKQNLTTWRLYHIKNFFDYMDVEATEGVEIKSTRGSSSSPMNLGYVGSYVYWGVEVMLVAGIAFAGSRRTAHQPYSETHSTWKTPEALGFIASDTPETVEAVRSGDIAALQRAGAGALDGSLVLSAAHCGDATPDDVDIKLERVVRNKQGKVERKTLVHNTWPHAALAALRAAFAPKPPPVAPPPLNPPAPPSTNTV